MDKEKMEQEQKLYQIALEFAQKGIDIEKAFKQIEDELKNIFKSEEIQELIRLANKNYKYLSKTFKDRSDE